MTKYHRIRAIKLCVSVCAFPFLISFFVLFFVLLFHLRFVLSIIFCMQMKLSPTTLLCREREQHANVAVFVLAIIRWCFQVAHIQARHSHTNVYTLDIIVNHMCFVIVFDAAACCLPAKPLTIGCMFCVTSKISCIYYNGYDVRMARRLDV